MRYPAGWVDGARPPLWTCVDCPVFGPPNADPPRGVILFDTSAPSGRCEISCFAGNDAVGFSAEITVTVGGRDARQMEFDRTTPPPLEGKWPLYREVWTAVRGGRGLLIIAGFWPKDDVSSETEVRSAYDRILRSLEFVGAQAPPAPTQPGGNAGGIVRGPDTGTGSSAGSRHGSLLVILATLALVAGLGVSAVAIKARR